MRVNSIIPIKSQTHFDFYNPRFYMQVVHYSGLNDWRREISIMYYEGKLYLEGRIMK